MSKAKDRAEFLAVMLAEFGNTPEVAQAAALLMRHAVTHGNLALQDCNVGLDSAGQKREAQIEKRITAIAHAIGATVVLDSEPRGFTVKVVMPKTGRSNSFAGNSLWGVPQ